MQIFDVINHEYLIAIIEFPKPNSFQKYEFRILNQI